MDAERRARLAEQVKNTGILKLLGAKAEGLAPGQTLVRGDDVLGTHGLSVPVQFPTEAQGHAVSFTAAGHPI